MMTTEVIGILDMDMGNLRSVANATYQLGFDPVVVSDVRQFDDLSHLIIPGVGQFATAIRHLEERRFRDAIIRYAASGRPVMGICLGMQLLATHGFEGGETQGLDLVPGAVRRLPDEGGLRLPHVGWNRAGFLRPHPVFDGIKPERDFYFVHSFAFYPDESTDALAETDYGTRFTSIVGRGAAIGLQFHPEKSQVNGLKLLENFCHWDGRS